MLRVSPETQQSRVRISTLAAEIYRAIGTVLDGDENLTYEEICVALNSVMARQLMHLMAEDPEPQSEDGP